jgi:hypothetical protein
MHKDQELFTALRDGASKNELEALLRDGASASATNKVFK